MRCVVSVCLGFSVLISAVPASAQEGAKVLRNRPTVAGGGAGQSIDLYLCDKGTRRPLVIFVHGGGWRIGDKKRVQLKPAAFAERGILFASLNYRLDVGFRKQARDVAAGVAWAAKHAARHGGDPSKIYLMGHSAGAHLAALIATDPRYLKSQGLGLKALAGVILLDGAGYDIPLHLKSARPRARELYTRVFGEDVKEQSAASPVRQVKSGRRYPPFLIVHVADRQSSRRQSELLAKVLKAAGGKAEVLAAAGKTHASLNREFGKVGDPAARAAFRFINGEKKKETKQRAY